MIYCWENYTYTLRRIQSGPLFSRGGGGGGGGGGGEANFSSGGPNANFYRNPYTYL